MRLLLDTNVFLRWMAGSPLPRPVERALSKQRNECLVSIVTGWEIVMKSKLGVSAAEVEAGIHEMGAALLPIRFTHLDELSRLPLWEDHRDPFDRMPIAQALAEQAVLISSDERFALYKKLRVVWD